MLTRKAFSDDAVNDDDGNDELMIFDWNREELAAFAAWFTAKEKGCRHIWTPFSDRDQEGEGTFSIQAKYSTDTCIVVRGVGKSSKQDDVPIFTSCESKPYNGTWTAQRRR